MRLIEELRGAEGRYLARRTGYRCRHRLGRVGTRSCRGCGGTTVLLDVFQCSLRDAGVTVEEECRGCAERTDGCGERESAFRRGRCMACPRHRVEDGVLRCELCRCDDPWWNRAWCPSKRWGREAWERSRRAYEKGMRGSGADVRGTER